MKKFTRLLSIAAALMLISTLAVTTVLAGRETFIEAYFSTPRPLYLSE